VLHQLPGSSAPQQAVVEQGSLTSTTHFRNMHMLLWWKQWVWLFIPPKAFSKHQMSFAEMKLSFSARWVFVLKIHPVLTKLFILATEHAVVIV